MHPNDTPTEPMPSIPAGRAPILPRLVEPEETPVHFVKAPRSPFLFPGIAAFILLAFLGGMVVAGLLGVNVPTPLQAGPPRVTKTAPATAKPERSDPVRDVPVDQPTKPGRTTKTTGPAPGATDKPSASPTRPSLQPTATRPASPPESTQPVTPPASKPAAEPPAGTPEPTPPAPTQDPATEVPSTPPTTQTSQSADTSTPTP